MTEYEELPPIAEPKLNEALVIVPAGGVVVQLPAVWLAQTVLRAFPPTSASISAFWPI